jgi:hypothetical protein
MAEQNQTVAPEPQLVQGQEEVPDKVVEAIVDGDQPNGYKIVRTATGKNYVEVSACQRERQMSGGAGDTPATAQRCNKQLPRLCLAGQ